MKIVSTKSGSGQEEEWKRAYREIQWFEEDLVNSDITVIKFFIHIDSETQKTRFEERDSDPLRRWKLTEEDWRNREKWGLYEEAIEDMLLKTHTESAPWVVLSGNDKYNARL